MLAVVGMRHAHSTLPLPNVQSKSRCKKKAAVLKTNTAVEQPQSKKPLPHLDQQPEGLGRQRLEVLLTVGKVCQHHNYRAQLRWRGGGTHLLNQACKQTRGLVAGYSMLVYMHVRASVCNRW